MKRLLQSYIHTLQSTLALALLIALSGCSGDDVTMGTSTDGTLEGNFMMVRIAMDAPMGHTRAVENPMGGETGDGLRVGQYNENNIYEICIYKYSSPDGINASDDTPVTLLAYESDVNFRPTDADVDAQGRIVKEMKMNVGSYQYHAAAHDHFITTINTGMQGVSTTLGELRNYPVFKTCQQKGSQMKDYDHFAMSNASDSHFEGGIGTKDDPYVISIDVERTTARIDFAYSTAARSAGRFRIEGGQYIYKVEGDAKGEVRLTHVRVANAMQNAPYMIKRLAATASETPVYLADETCPATKYVVEPTTWTKTRDAIQGGTLNFNSWYGDSWYMKAVADYSSTTAPWFRPADRVHTGTGDGFTDGTSLDEVDRDWQYYVLGYANENTMVADQTEYHYTTGLILKATYVPEEVYGAVDAEEGTMTKDETYQAGSTLWRCHDVSENTDIFFSNKAAAQAYQALHSYVLVTEYPGAQCYYNVWLRHENIVDDPTTTMMEFGIVRNNIYRVTVEFTGIGMPVVPEDITTPETIRMYIFVRKWNLISHPEIEI